MTLFNRSPRPEEAGRRVRVLRGPRPERAAGHGVHRYVRSRGRCPASAQGRGRLPAGAARMNAKKLSQPTLFDTHRFHAFFTTSTLDTITADQVHRGHAIIEQVHADLKHSALAHLPSGSSPRTPPGSSSPSSRSTSPAPPRPSPVLHSRKRQRSRSAGNSSPSPRGSRPPGAASECISPKPGPGKQWDRHYSRTPSRHREADEPDRPAAKAPTK